MIQRIAEIATLVINVKDAFLAFLASLEKIWSLQIVIIPACPGKGV